MRLLYALLSTGIGVALLLWGYRLARWLIPLAGFLAGLAIGGAVMADIGNTSFLGTAFGVIIGVITGLVLAALAYFYYYVAVIVLAGGVGYWAGSSFILLLGFSPGLISALIGIALGVMVGLLAMMTNAPRYMLIALTSFAGALTSVGGVMLLFHKIPLDSYSYTAVSLSLSNSFLWTLATAAVFTVGLAVQARTTSDRYPFDEWATGGHGGRGQVPPSPTPNVPIAH